MSRIIFNICQQLFITTASLALSGFLRSVNVDALVSVLHNPHWQGGYSSDSIPGNSETGVKVIAKTVDLEQHKAKLQRICSTESQVLFDAF